MTQYETNYCVPKKDLIDKIAKSLDVNPNTSHENSGNNASEIMQILFWLDETNPGALNLFQLEKYKDKANTSDDTNVRYHDNDN